MKEILRKDTLQTVLFFLLAFLFFVAILPESAFEGDLVFWYDWTKLIYDHGLGNIYNHKTEYHPFFLYYLFIFQWIMGSLDEIQAHFNYVKVFPLIFDFVGALSVLFVLKNEKNKLIYPFFLLFNIAYMYNTMLWGQLDSVHTAFVLLSLIFILKKRVLLSLFFLVFALNTKLQTIIYLPVLGLLFLPHFLKSYKVLLKGVAVVLLTQLIILIPFILADSLGGLWTVVTDVETRHPNVSMNAYNLWYYFEKYPPGVDDSLEFAMGWSYKSLGRALFFLFSTIALFPLLKHCFSWIKNKVTPSEKFMEMVFLTSALITIIFFYFNTQMHERYSHPAMILFFFYGVKSKRYLLYILCSLAYLFNMEAVLQTWDFSSYGILFFNDDFISSLYLLIIFISIFKLYRSYLKEPQPLPVM